MDGIAVLQRLREPLQEHHARAFTAHKAVGVSIERLAVSVRRQHRRLRKADEPARGDHHGHTSGHRGIAAPGPDVFARRVHGGERRRAGRVHGHARSLQIEAVGNAVRRNAVRATRGRMRGDPRRIPRCPLDHLIVIVRNAHVDREVRAVLQIEDKAGVFHRFIGRLEKHALLRVDVGRFARRDTEKLRIKLINPVHESTPLRNRLSGQPRLRIVKTVHVPPIRRHFAHGFLFLDQQFPQRIGVVNAAGEATTDTDDSYWFFGHKIFRTGDYLGPNSSA